MTPSVFTEGKCPVERTEDLIPEEDGCSSPLKLQKAPAAGGHVLDHKPKIEFSRHEVNSPELTSCQRVKNRISHLRGMLANVLMLTTQGCSYPFF